MNRITTNHFLITFLFLLMFIFQGCASDPGTHLAQCTNSNGAHIHAIGIQSILTFQQGEQLRIPIEGKGLQDNDVCMTAEITGTAPVQAEDWGFDQGLDKTNRSDLAALYLTPGYVKRLKSGDQITVHLFIARQSTLTNGFTTNIVTTTTSTKGAVTTTILTKPVPTTTLSNNTTAFATRTFTVYEADYYRTHVATTMVPIYDIQAFPLPFQEAKFLFGPLVANSYFVVKLSVRNTQGEDKLINSGMIVASGRAIVKADGDIFTLPIRVVPQSASHLYTILDDQEPYQWRAQFFRGLEFAGAIASATSVAFGGSPDLVKGIALGTGVLIPESKKLWTDPWPGYKRNIVSFSMPDLLKVPKGSVSGHKYLFFPRKDIEAIISDPTLFTSFLYLEKHFDFGNDLQAPPVKVISLAFDSLEIPFEQVVSAGDLDIFARLSKISQDIKVQEQALGEIQRGLSNTNFYFNSNLSRGAVSNFLSGINQIDISGLTNAADADFKSAVSNLAFIAKAFINQIYNDDLVKSPTAGLEMMKTYEQMLNNLSRSVLGGADGKTYESTLGSIESAIAESQAGIIFYQQCAILLTDEQFSKLIKISVQTKTVSDVDREKLIRGIKAVLEFRQKYTFMPGLQTEPSKQ